MGMTLDFPAGGGPMGPGYLVAVIGALGPTALTDICNVWVETALGSTLCQGTTFFDGHTFALVTIGVFASDLHGTIGVTAPTAPGAPARLHVSHFNPTGGLIEEVFFPGFTWDPTGGLWALASLGLIQSTSADLTAVLAAVRRTFP